LATVTWAHFAIIANNRREAILALCLTILFALLFTALQGYEYYEAAFTIADGVYGSTFFMATGFHGYNIFAPTKFISFSPRSYFSSLTSSLILKPSQGTFSLDHSFIQWFVGFSDGEGNFNISLRNLQNNFYNSVILTFQIGLHIDDLEVLKFIQSKLNCGHISVSGSKCNYFVNDQASLIDIILPIFKVFPLNSTKYYQFLIFEKAVNLFKNKFHLTPQGRLLMIQYYNEMIYNNSLSNFPSRNIHITNFWLGGFTDGEGSFSTNKHVPRLKYENHSKEHPLFLKIQEFFSIFTNSSIGNLSISLRPNRINSHPTVVLEFNQIHFLKNIIIPFFLGTNLPILYTKKIKDFHDWSSLVYIYYYGYHLLPNGMEVINLLKSRMNNFRLSTNKIKEINEYINIDEKLVNLLNSLSPYEIKNGIRFIRNTDKLVSEKLKIIAIDQNQNKTIFTSITECSKHFHIERSIIKECLLSGKMYKNYIFKIKEENLFEK
jgi:hypothetical protein